MGSAIAGRFVGAAIVESLLLFLILFALSPRLARGLGKVVVGFVLLVVAICVLAAWPRL